MNEALRDLDADRRLQVTDDPKDLIEALDAALDEIERLRGQLAIVELRNKKGTCNHAQFITGHIVCTKCGDSFDMMLKRSECQ